MDYAAMGQRIRTIRRNRRMTQEEVADRAGISASFLGHIERGSRVASIETLVQLCRALRASPNELLAAEVGELCAELPEQLTLSVPDFLQGVADLLKSRQIPDD